MVQKTKLIDLSCSVLLVILNCLKANQKPTVIFKMFGHQIKMAMHTELQTVLILIKLLWEQSDLSIH